MHHHGNKRICMMSLVLLMTCAVLMSACVRQQNNSFSLIGENGSTSRFTQNVFEFPQNKQVGRKGLPTASYDFALAGSGEIVHGSLCLNRENVYWGYHPVSLNGHHVGNVLPNTYGALYSRPKQSERFCVNLPTDALKDGDNTLTISSAVARETFALGNAAVIVLRSDDSSAIATGTASLPPNLTFLETLTPKEQYLALVKSPEIRTELMLENNDDARTAAHALSLIGGYHTAQGNFLAALDAHERAVAMARKRNSPLLPSYLLRLGEAHAALGDTETATLFFEETLALGHNVRSAANIQGNDPAMGGKAQTKERLSPLAQDSMARIALSALELGDVERAEDIASQLLDNSGNRDFYTYVDKKSWWNPVPLATAYMVIGEANLRQGYYHEAERAFEDAYVFLPSINAGLEHRAIYGQAKAQFHAGQFAIVLETLERLHDSGHETRWKSTFLKGRVFEEQGQLERAVAQYATSIDLIEISRSRLGDHNYKMSFMDNKQEPYARIINCLLRLRREKEALEYMERAKARAFVDLLANRDDIHLSAVDSADQATIMHRLAALEQRHAIDEDGEEAFERSQETDTARKALKARSPQLASLIMVETPRVEAIRDHLANDEVLVEFFTHGSEAMVIAVSRNDIDSAILQGAGLDKDVIRFRQSLSDPTSQRWKADAKRLHDRLLAPVGPSLEGKKLVIVPHGILHYLPFGALMNKDRVLIQDHAIRILPSASVQGQLEASAPNGKSLLILGNPDLGDPSLNLPGAEVEARQVRTLWPESRVLLGKNASETMFKETSPHFSSLHVAAHGQFSPHAPLESALLLSPDDTNDGRLTVAELYGLRLNADLVVLSACESGLGSMRSGDEMVSLTRGFFYAGSRSILASLWKIPDAETTSLMETFHRFNDKESWSEALRKAQLVSYERFGHPYYWAGFELFGL